MSESPQPIERLRRICLGLPEAHETQAWGGPTFRVRNRMFAMYAEGPTHHGGGRSAVWVKAGPGEQTFLVRAAPDRFFVPPYMGPSGWVGVWLDGEGDWDELAELLRDGWGLVAPKSLRALVAR